MQWTSHDVPFSVVKAWGGDTLFTVSFWNADFLIERHRPERVV
jgi:hypothetical protein